MSFFCFGLCYTWIVILKPWGRLGWRVVVFSFGNTYLLCVISVMITSGSKLVMRVNGLAMVSLGGPLSIPYLMLATLDLLPDYVRIYVSLANTM